MADIDVTHESLLKRKPYSLAEVAVLVSMSEKTLNMLLFRHRDEFEQRYRRKVVRNVTGRLQHVQVRVFYEDEIIRIQKMVTLDFEESKYRSSRGLRRGGMNRAQSSLVAWITQAANG